MTVRILMVSSGYEELMGMTYPIRLALAMNGLPSIEMGILCQNMEEDIEDINVFTYGGNKLIDRENIEKKELDHLLNNIGREWDLIIAGSDSVVEVANHIAIAISRPITGFFMGFPESRMLYPIYQKHYTNKLIYFHKYIPRTLVPSYYTDTKMRFVGFGGITSVVPLGIENFSDIEPMDVDMKHYDKLFVTINRDADHKNMEDFFIMANMFPQHYFIWITYRPKTAHLKQMQPSNLSIQRATDVAKLSLIKRADAFIFTSWDEGYLLSCMEAIACKVKVIVKASKLAYELLWNYSKSGLVSFYNDASNIDLSKIAEIDNNNLPWIDTPDIMQTGMFICSLIFNDIKTTHVKNTFNGKLVPSSQQVASLYDTMYHFDNALIEMKGVSDPYHEDNWKYIFISQHIKGDYVIDMGCGRGNTTKKLLDDNYKVTAYDISKKAVLALRDKYRDSVISGKLVVEQFDINNPTPGSTIADTIICEEILEHVQDPSIVIKNTLALANGMAIFTTPIEHAADDPGHIQHFTRENIELIFSEIEADLNVVMNSFQIIDTGHPGRPEEDPSHFMIVVDISG